MAGVPFSLVGVRQSNHVSDDYNVIETNSRVYLYTVLYALCPHTGKQCVLYNYVCTYIRTLIHHPDTVSEQN